MKRTVFAIILILMFILSSCKGEVLPKEEEIKNPEAVFENHENFEEEILPEKTKPEKKKEDEETAVLDEGEKKEDEKSSSEDKEPMPEDIIGIDTENSNNEPVSRKQLEYVIALLEPENWEEAKDYEPKAKCFAGTVFNVRNGGFIAANFYEDKTLILKKWGENQQYRAYYYAPKEVAELAALFAEKTEESKITYDRWEDVTKNYPEYDDKLSYFGSGLNGNYSENDYSLDTPYIAMLFDHAYELEKSAGRIEKDEYYPIYPAEFVEELLCKYYLFSAEDIKSLSGKYVYDAKNDTYNMEGGYGGAYPIPKVTDIIDNGETFELYVDLHSSVDGYRIEQSSILKIRPNADGSWTYLGNKIYFERNYDKTE